MKKVRMSRGKIVQVLSLEQVHNGTCCKGFENRPGNLRRFGRKFLCVAVAGNEYGPRAWKVLDLPLEDRTSGELREFFRILTSPTTYIPGSSDWARK